MSNKREAAGLPKDEHYTLDATPDVIQAPDVVMVPETHLWLGELFVGQAPDFCLCWKADPSLIPSTPYAISVDVRKECVTCQNCLELIHS